MSFDERVYMPASFFCRKCGERLSEPAPLVATGDLSMRDDEPKTCSKDGAVMHRMTWKQAYMEAIVQQAELTLALVESVTLQSHYAMLLNGYDGGKRLQFSCAAAWIERLKTTGSLPGGVDGR